MIVLRHALLALLAGCSLVNDFDHFRFESDAEAEDGARPRKPPRPDAGDADVDLDAETLQDGAPAPVDGSDDGMLEPPREAGQTAPEGGTRDAGMAPGLEGAWDVQLPLTRESCSGNAPLDVDTWTLELLGARGRLHTSWWTFEGVLELAAGRAVGGRFEGLLEGAFGGPGTRWVVELELVGAGVALAGRTTQSTVWQDGGVSCVVERDVQGVR